MSQRDTSLIIQISNSLMSHRKLEYLHRNRIIYRRYPIYDKPNQVFTWGEFYQNGTYHSKLYDKIVLPVFSKIITDIEKKECTLLRSKLNGYVNHYKQVEHDWHTDLESGEPYKSALFYINTINRFLHS